MATKEHEHGYGDEDLVKGDVKYSSQVYDEKPGSDPEVNPSSGEGSAGKDDPFGDETNSDIKYRTMTWWSVVSSGFKIDHSADRILTGKQQ